MWQKQAGQARDRHSAGPPSRPEPSRRAGAGLLPARGGRRSFKRERGHSGGPRRRRAAARAGEMWGAPGPSGSRAHGHWVRQLRGSGPSAGKAALSLVNNVLTLVQNTAVTVIKNPPGLVCQCSFHRKSVTAWRSPVGTSI